MVLRAFDKLVLVLVTTVASTTRLLALGDVCNTFGANAHFDVVASVKSSTCVAHMDDFIRQLFNAFHATVATEGLRNRSCHKSFAVVAVEVAPVFAQELLPELAA